MRERRSMSGSGRYERLKCKTECLPRRYGLLREFCGEVKIFFERKKVCKSELCERYLAIQCINEHISRFKDRLSQRPTQRKT